MFYILLLLTQQHEFAQHLLFGMNRCHALAELIDGFSQRLDGVMIGLDGVMQLTNSCVDLVGLGCGFILVVHVVWYLVEIACFFGHAHESASLLVAAKLVGPDEAVLLALVHTRKELAARVLGVITSDVALHSSTAIDAKETPLHMRHLLGWLILIPTIFIEAFEIARVSHFDVIGRRKL